MPSFPSMGIDADRQSEIHAGVGWREISRPALRLLAMAERLCRAVDRIGLARVLGSHHYLQRGAPAPDSKSIRRLLQLRQNASVFAPDFPSYSSDRNHSFTPDPRRASPSLRPGLSFRYTQSFFAAYVTIVGCMILYGLRMIDQQLDEPIDESEADLE